MPHRGPALPARLPLLAAQRLVLRTTYVGITCIISIVLPFFSDIVREGCWRGEGERKNAAVFCWLVSWPRALHGRSASEGACPLSCRWAWWAR